MSPDRHGSGATRIEADLSIKRGERTDAQSIHLSCRPGPGRALALTSVASAAPTVMLKAKAVPIPGFPHTGNILGAGAARRSRIHDHRHRIRRVPAAADRRQLLSCRRARKLHTPRLPDVLRRTRSSKKRNPKSCPKGSSAGPVGHADGFVAFGSERVPETATIESFYAPGGGLEFFTAGHTPVSLEILSHGQLQEPQRHRRLRPRAGTRRCRSWKRSPARLTRRSKRSSVKVGSAYKKHRQARLLRHGAEEVPEGRLPDQDRSDVRRTRRPAPADGCRATTRRRAPGK